ncbi:MAG: hypothetical protein M1817_006131 [Caeruleum heppii]|nr:MAG: hypothetical protein M1817_006131 [Caeruleum heppii]
MTTYLSSLIIDPVLHQVRRLSACYAATDLDPLPSFSQILTLAQDDDEDDAASMSSAIDPTDAAGVTSDNISGQPIVFSPATSPAEESDVETQWGSSRPRTLPILSSESRRHIPSSAPRSVAVDDGLLPFRRNGLPRHFALQSDSIPVGLRDATHDVSTAIMSPAEGPSPRESGDTHQSTTSVRGGTAGGSLPADDGRSLLRRRIIEIQGSDISAPSKARMMHDLMLEDYSQARGKLRNSNPPTSPSLSTLRSSGRSHTPSCSSLDSDDRHSSKSDFGSALMNRQEYRVSHKDLEPTYYVKPPSKTRSRATAPETSDDEDDEDRIGPAFGCQHYKRNVKLQCSACSRWYTCRFCHDEVEDHPLDRKATQNMLCMLCGRAQAAGEFCTQCDQRTAWYYCNICKLWDDDSEKSIYHCTDCGICRVGRGLGKDFIHCKTCGVCMSISIAKSHKCIERSTDCDCPICGEYMFTSPLTVVFMQCGHSIHHQCYYEHMKTSYRCPICSRSIVNMEIQFRNLDRSIEDQPMPPQFQDTRALVYCNDCCAKSSVKYHWLGLKCAVCDSYNTAQLQILSGSDPPASDPQPQPQIRPPDSTAISDPTTTTPEDPIIPSSVGLDPASASPPTSRHAPVRRGRPTSSHGTNVRFSPYPTPERAGRSVSPLSTLGGSRGEDENTDVRMWVDGGT